jgi:hypothetical protein
VKIGNRKNRRDGQHENSDTAIRIFLGD